MYAGEDWYVAMPSSTSGRTVGISSILQNIWTTISDYVLGARLISVG
jgi:hypothetical protein